MTYQVLRAESRRRFFQDFFVFWQDGFMLVNSLKDFHWKNSSAQFAGSSFQSISLKLELWQSEFVRFHSLFER